MRVAILDIIQYNDVGNDNTFDPLNDTVIQTYSLRSNSNPFDPYGHFDPFYDKYSNFDLKEETKVNEDAIIFLKAIKSPEKGNQY